MAVKDENIFSYVSLKKWNKGEGFIINWLNELEEAGMKNRTALLDHKTMEEGRGFLVYLARTYTSIVPYLKGIHLTIDSWRDGRDEEGWKLRTNARRKLDSNEDDSHSISTQRTTKTTPPKVVKPVKRLLDDLRCLSHFFDEETPPWRFVRGKTIYIAKYGFADASKRGFGSSKESDKGIVYRYRT